MVAELERSWNSSSCYSQCKFAATPIRPAKNKHKIAVEKSVCTIQGDFWKIGRASPFRPRPKKATQVTRPIPPRKVHVRPRRITMRSLRPIPLGVLWSDRHCDSLAQLDEAHLLFFGRPGRREAAGLPSGARLASFYRPITLRFLSYSALSISPRARRRLRTSIAVARRWPPTDV